MHLWTFICELCGGIYISQYQGDDVSDAIQGWTKDELPNVLKLASKDAPGKYKINLDVLDATPLDGLRQAYCWTFGLSYKKFWLFPALKTGLVNIIQTKPESS